MENNDVCHIDTLEGCQKLAKMLPDINTEIGREGGTLLELACAFTNDLDVITFLLESGADVHHADKYGRNSFAYAWFNKTPYMDVLINGELKNTGSKFAKL